MIKSFSLKTAIFPLQIVLLSLPGFLPVSVSAQKKSTGSKMSAADAQKMLDHHNLVRRNVGVGPLKWNGGLAAYAQAWADYLASSNGCRLMHRSGKNKEGKSFGENIFGGSSGDFYNALNASEAWYSEIKDFRYGVLTEQNWYGTGHYTQMVWRNTTSIGAGIAQCPSGGVVIVANYDPPGNYLGEAPY